MLFLAAPLVLLVVAWRQVDLPAGAARLAATGPLVVVALLPLGALLALDALGWRLLFAPASRLRVSFGQALAARLAGEAVASLPSAGLAAEAASAWYLWRRTGVPIGESIGTLAARRVLLAPGHGAMLATGALLAAGLPDVPSPLVALLAAAALGLLLAAVVGSRLLARGAPFARVHLALRRAPWAWLRARAAAGVPGLRLADREAARTLVGSWRPRVASLACFALVFLTESIEAFVLLRLVGAEVSFAQVTAIEPLVSLLRALAFFAPLGLGVQELGYVALLHELAVPQAAAVAAAFVLFKRGREAASTALGWAVLLTVDAQAGPGTEEANEPRERQAAVHLRVAQPDDADAPDRARVA